MERRRFTFIEENTGKMYWFPIDDEVDDWAEGGLIDQLYDEVVADGLETESRYGVHDFSSSGEDIGFTSYEVTDEHMSELMEIFHAWFEKKGQNPGPIQIGKCEW